MPEARVYNSANINLPTSGATVVLTFNSERTDNDGMHSTSSNTNRITCTTPGLYHIGSNVNFPFVAGTTARTVIMYHTNAANTVTTPIAVENVLSTAGNTIVSVNTVYRCTAGEFFTVAVQQHSAGAMNPGVTAISNYSPEFYAARLGP